MMRFPPTDSPLARRFDKTLVENDAKRGNLPHIKDAVSSAIVEFDELPTLKSLCYVIAKSNGDAVLLEIKRSGTRKELWNFGQ